MEWAVLDWNEPAIGFYKKLGAKPMEEWTVFRLTSDGIAAGEGRSLLILIMILILISGTAYEAERIMSRIMIRSRNRSRRR